MIKSEMETTIVFDAENDNAVIWTAYPPMQTKLAKLGLVGKPVGPGLQYEIDKKWVRIRRPRQITEKLREEMRQRARSLHSGTVINRPKEATAENAAQSAGAMG